MIHADINADTNSHGSTASSNNTNADTNMERNAGNITNTNMYKYYITASTDTIFASGRNLGSALWFWK